MSKKTSIVSTPRPNNSSLRDVFVSALGLPLDTDFESLEYSQNPKWDSVGHMQLVAAIERTFKIMLEVDDVLGMKSYPITREILRKYGISFTD
jgi:acyl carrier protein